MKNIIFCLFITTICIFTGCADDKVSNTGKSYSHKDFKLEVITIDSCQYLYGPWGNATVLTHKGNCNNQLHEK